MKPITIAKKNQETLFEAAKRAAAQADLNNKTVLFQDGEYTCLVYPNDIINNVIKAIKRIALMIEISRLENAIK